MVDLCTNDGICAIFVGILLCFLCFGVIKLVKKKVEKGKSVDVIAYELEETPEEVQKICDVIEESGAECSIEEIYKKLYE